MELIDIGCNLTHDSFDVDRDKVIEAAFQAGVSQMIVTGASAEGSQQAVQLADEWPQHLFATVGVHPHRASAYDDETDQLLSELADRANVVAIGETGLDYFRDFSPREDQRSSFEQQIQIAIDTGLPFFLHQRDAHEDFVAILKQYRDQLNEVVVHCFTGSKTELHECLDLDFYIGITGWICDERRGTHLQELIKEIPLNRLMLETDFCRDLFDAPVRSTGGSHTDDLETTQSMGKAVTSSGDSRVDHGTKIWMILSAIVLVALWLWW